MGQTLRSNCCNARVILGTGALVSRENNNDAKLKISNKAAKEDDITQCAICGKLLADTDTHTVDTKSTVSASLQTKGK